MTQIIRLKQATGAQLQQAAQHARLIDVPNMPYGFGNAYYSSAPSPMQVQVLRKGLQAAGINYLKVEECVTAASEADRFPRECQEGLKKLVSRAVAILGSNVDLAVGVAGKTLTAALPAADATEARKAIRAMAKPNGFVRTIADVNSELWTKRVRYKGGKVFVATIEAAGQHVRLTVFKGA
jgi:hypothetical protein